MLHKRLRQCWRTGDFVVAEHMVTKSFFYRSFSSLFVALTFCSEISCWELIWCTQVSGLVRKSLQLESVNQLALGPIVDIYAISRSCVVLAFADEMETLPHPQMLSLFCIDLSSDGPTVRWKNCYNSPVGLEYIKTFYIDSYTGRWQV